MYFLQPLLFATSALAASQVRRQSAAPTDLPQAFAIIEADTTNLNAATQAFTGDFCPLIAATSTLLSDIQAGIALAEASPELTIDQIIAILGPTQSLATAVDTAINSTIDKYDAFVTAGVARVVYNGLLTQQTLSGQFSDAVVAALPEGLQEAGRMNSAPIAASLARGVAAFADAPGSDTPPSCDGSSSSTTSSSSTSSTTSSSSTSTSSSSSMITPQPYPYPTGPASYTTTSAAPQPYPNSSPPPQYGSGTPPKYHSSEVSPPSYGTYAPHPYPSKESHPPVYETPTPHPYPSEKPHPPVYYSPAPHPYSTKKTHPPVYETVTVYPSHPVYTKPQPSVQPSIQPTPPAYHPPKTERPNASYPVQTVTVISPKPYHPSNPSGEPTKPESPKGSYAPPVGAPSQNPPVYAPPPSKTDNSPNAPSATYSPPPEYTGGAVKAAAGVGALAMAVVVAVL